MFYGREADDFVGLSDLAQLPFFPFQSAVVPGAMPGAMPVGTASGAMPVGTATLTRGQERRCNAAQKQYANRSAAFQRQLSRARTPMAAQRIQNQATRALARIQTLINRACQLPVGGSLITPAGGGQPPPYPGTYVGQVVPDASGQFQWSWTGTAWQQSITTAPAIQPYGGNYPPMSPGSYVGQQATGTSGQLYTWNGTSWVLFQSQAPSPYPQPYPYPYGYQGPMLTPIDSGGPGGDIYSTGGGAYPMVPAGGGGPLLQPIGGDNIYDEIRGGGGGGGAEAQACRDELSNPATEDAFGPLQTVQIVCASGAAPRIASSSSSSDGGFPSQGSVEQSEIAMSGFAGLGRYLG